MIPRLVRLSTAVRGCHISTHHVTTRSFSQLRPQWAAKLSKVTKPKPTKLKAPAAQPSTKPPSPTGSEEPKYPPILRIFERSPAKLSMLGIMRLTPYLVYSLWLFRIGYEEILQRPEIPDWQILLYALPAAVPIMLVGSATTGIVSRISVKLPQGARDSEQALRRWMSNMKGDDWLEIRTVKVHGFGGNVNWVQLKELSVMKDSKIWGWRWKWTPPPDVAKSRSGIFPSLWKKAIAPPQVLKLGDEEGFKRRWIGGAVRKYREVDGDVFRAIMAGLRKSEALKT